MKWHIIFLVLIALANIHVFITMDSNPQWLGFPIWIGIYVIVHLAYMVFLYQFSESIKAEKL